jgi:hypothetical protein
MEDAMFITLYAVMCLASATPGVVDSKACVREIVTDQYLSPDISMGTCLGIAGLNSAEKFKEEHPLYHSEQWRLGGWSCRFGNKPMLRQNDI